VAEIVNFQQLTVWRNRKQSSSSFNSKGHAVNNGGVGGFLRGEGEHPLPYEQSRQSIC